MTYNTTAIYGNGVIGNFYYIDLASNGILLDVILVVMFIVIYGILAGRQYKGTNTFLMTSFILFIFMGALTFGVSAAGFQADSYFTHTIFMFALTIAILLYHILSEA